ncbi:hypothetical protein M407DRAFT_137165 [Tulasnella calospora MUT 4182]|uniref:thioredoxin-dependent peroxiredoxin n=1 Tax=Tulasnella calospora MUT 4182 TaxID=1051891 RepID=A0A0C3Q892_9AGAM|nr:hypothetical protein M407DRAFT_137165 [Tulasnella calospora MUT 4182]
MVHPLIGKKAPEVTLPSANGAPYDLKPGASGRPLALFFYPASGTYGCTREACSFRDALSSSDVFKSTECDVVGISKDPPAQQKAFVDQHGLPYPVLSDAEGKAREAYEVGRGLFNLTEGVCLSPSHSSC